MAYIRRLYYDKANGNGITWYQMSGDFEISTVDEDFQTISELAPFKGVRDSVGLLEWEEVNAEMDAAFGEAYKVDVDVTKALPELKFDFDWPEVEEPDDDANQLLNIIEGRN